jgi:ubiquinone/menaquinone biosynthesis C-methylase UbiE
VSQAAVTEPAPVDRSGLTEAYFDTMAEHATTHWWYRARSAWVTQELRGKAGTLPALDVGCGTGATLAALRAAGYSKVAGVDVSEFALDRARGSVGGALLVMAEADTLPVGDSSLSCITSMDVLEHLDDDAAALRDYIRVLEPGGRILLTTPAYQWLFSDHDRTAQHRRRYTARRLAAVARSVGLEVEHKTYMFSFLVPAAALLRRTPLRKRFGATDEATSSASPVLNAILRTLCRAELAIGRVVPIPFGLTCLAVVRLPKA